MQPARTWATAVAFQNAYNEGVRDTREDHQAKKESAGGQ